MGARDTALSVLISCRKGGAWSDGALKHQIAQDRLDRRDAALASRLCYGVLQNRMLLDYWTNSFVQRKIQPNVRDILRLAVYQIRFLDKIPENAVVFEAVEQTKRLENDKAAGFVNAVLRNMLRNRKQMKLPKDLPTRYSHPEELVELLRENVGEDRLEALLQSNNEAPETYVQVNTVRESAEAVTEMLRNAHLQVTPHPWLPDCLLVSGGSIEQTEAYRNGLIYAQDPAARLAVAAAGLTPGMQVLDCCAAPGGKSFAAAITMNNQGVIFSCDLYKHKIELLEKGTERMQLSSVHPMQQNALGWREDWMENFDAVLCDVPCSGFGVIRKKPDIRYKKLDDLEPLPKLQSWILLTQADYVRPGGVLLYSTCTLLKRENEDIIHEFLARRKDYTVEAFSLPNGIQAPNGMCTLLPCDQGTDGFFLCKLRRLS